MLPLVSGVAIRLIQLIFPAPSVIEKADMLISPSSIRISQCLNPSLVVTP
jgi:hypothetical protein